CTVNDGHGGVVSDSIGVEVRDFSHQQTGQLAAYYPFNGNADDFSGFNNNGIVHNVTLTADRFNNPNSAYYFNGVNSFIEVPSDSNLNFQKSITINFWIKIDNFPAREEYVISHGSYENRWKISILTDKYLRWTIHTSDTKNNGIIDLDSETKLKRNTWYNISVLYDGVDCEIYLNGNLDSFSPWSGSILKTSIPLTIGQMLPNNNNYNFNGILDDIRIYNYALPFQKIKELYDFKTGLKNEQEPIFPYKDVLEQNFPNPFNPSTKISFWLKNSSFVTLVIYNLLGQKITTLINKYLTTGKHSINWDADGLSSGIYFSILKTKSYTLIRKMVLLR
ncbi:MAG TPA: T9SS type A sorting domain-containing protein, partial [Ignavibacteria bacterium]|nr:T9SS type A sorting domain-containing protein [Ignavibacteria bacterium]